MEFAVIHQEQTPKTPAIRGIKKFIEENAELMVAFKDYTSKLNHMGMEPAGLAANQCSCDGERINKRFIIKTDRVTTPGGNFVKKFVICINPKIVEKDGIAVQKREGCLTWGPKKMVVADRYPNVKVTYYDIHGTKKTVHAEGFEAQVWQHEINHLDGVEEDIHEKHQQLISTKVQNNDICPYCDSGKKYKKCCKYGRK